MKTSIILGICLTLLSAVALCLILFYVKKLIELSKKEEDLAAQAKGIQKKQNALDRWECELKADMKRRAKAEHVWYNVQVADDGSESTLPTKTVIKALKSGIGYKIVPMFEKNIKLTKEDGKKRFSLDILVMPFEEQTK